MNICHTFAAPPDGASGAARLVTGEGVVYSDGDFGCLWDGAGPAETGRESIRSAVELGTNLGVYSHTASHRELSGWRPSSRH